MNVRFLDATVTMRYDNYARSVKKKQEIADYLLGKKDQGMMIFKAPINERELLMSYLPFIHAIAFFDPEIKLEKYEIKLEFMKSSLASPSNVILQVSPELYYYLQQ